jgi:hypothetical protein
MECNKKDFIAKMKIKHRNDELSSLVPLIGQVCELLSIELCNRIEAAESNGDNHVNFMSFWKVSWRRNRFNELKFISSFAASATARNLTSRFLTNGGVVDKEMIQCFFSIVARPPAFMDLVEELSKIVYESNKHNKFFSSELESGKNVSYLLNVIFKGILQLTYEDGLEIELPHLGRFKRSFKSGRKKEFSSSKTIGGILQFEIFNQNVNFK